MLSMEYPTAIVNRSPATVPEMAADQDLDLEVGPEAEVGPDQALVLAAVLGAVLVVVLVVGPEAAADLGLKMNRALSFLHKREVASGKKKAPAVFGEIHLVNIDMVYVDVIKTSLELINSHAIWKHGKTYQI